MAAGVQVVVEGYAAMAFRSVTQHKYYVELPAATSTSLPKEKCEAEAETEAM